MQVYKSPTNRSASFDFVKVSRAIEARLSFMGSNKPDSYRGGDKGWLNL